MRRFAFLVPLLAHPLAAQDLTGIWRDNNARQYVMRQAGEEFCWSIEKTNVFCGLVIGNIIAGRWLDLPTGPYRGGGQLVLKIESANRLTKVQESTATVPGNGRVKGLARTRLRHRRNRHRRHHRHSRCRRRHHRRPQPTREPESTGIPDLSSRDWGAVN